MRNFWIHDLPYPPYPPSPDHPSKGFPTIFSPFIFIDPFPVVIKEMEDMEDMEDPKCQWMKEYFTLLH
jgi:hypothetical protein